MKQTIGLNEFRDAFASYERYNFSYEGLAILFEALEDLEQSTGNEMELDVIGLCCDYCEMSLGEVLASYDDITDEELTDDNEVELLGIVTDYLDDNTWILGITDHNTFVFQQF